MRIIKIMIAASEEMHEETIKFSELIANLNEVLEPKNIELQRVKWNPEKDGSLEDYKRQLTDSEMCLTLYWRRLAANSEKGLDTAYEELRKGNNPKKLYVFFKEPSEDISETLRGFKANFVNTYGHFFCKFENADTMNLHFILQLEAFMNINDRQQFVRVKDGVVQVGEQGFVNLESIPFVAFNQEYQRYRNELALYDEQIAKARNKYMSEPDNLVLEDELMAIKSKRLKLARDLDSYQLRLHNIALYLVRHSGERYSDRMRKAREQFEMGNSIEADQILDLEEMEREAQSQYKEYEILRQALEQQENNLRMGIQEFCLKADTVLARVDIDVNDRFLTSLRACKNALASAKFINDFETIADTNMKIGDLISEAFLMGCNVSYMEHPDDYYNDALRIYQKLEDNDYQKYSSKVVEALNRLGDYSYQSSGYYGTDEDYWYIQSIKHKYKYKVTQEEYPAAVAMAIGDYYLDKSRWKDYSYDEAAASYMEAINLYEDLSNKHPDLFLNKMEEAIRKFNYAKNQ